MAKKSTNSPVAKNNNNHPNQKQFDALLVFLKASRGFDFSAYNQPSLIRRIEKRMAMVKVKTFEEYADYLEVHPDEFARLFDTILINVTAFFRDPPAWDFLAGEIIPKILKSRRGNEAIRIWSAGCASGEEAYTLAIVLSEALGLEAFQRRVKIYATDIDDAALLEARKGSYKKPSVEDLSSELKEKYFDRVRDRYQVRAEVRKGIIFGRHNLLSDAPISHLDLLVCRNTLIYFNAEAQSRILARCGFALRPNGYFFVGKAEMLVAHTNHFVPVGGKHRIFVKSPVNKEAGLQTVVTEAGAAGSLVRIPQQELLKAVAFESYPVALLLLDKNGIVTQINEHARTLLGLEPQDIGRGFHDLEVSYRPIELRSRIEQVYAKGRPIKIPHVQHVGNSGELQSFDVELVPLIDKAGASMGVSIAYHDMTMVNLLKAEHGRAVQELETTYEELQSTNEELQTTNEELETTNEELQSANEEMETMNEELQSTNDELRNLNEQLNTGSQSADKTSSFLQSVLAGLDDGVIVLDGSLTVLAWNAKSENLWGLRADETIGQSFMNLDIGLPVERLKDTLSKCLKGDTPRCEQTVDAVNRRGKAIRCSVTCTPLKDVDKRITGAILVLTEAGT